MPVKPSYPGVYIEEIPSGVRTTIGVHTGIGVVLGLFANGPKGVPTRVGSWAEFFEIYGDGQPSRIASYTVKQFFDNGGARLCVVRASGSAVRLAPSIVRSLQALDRIDHFTLLSIPDTAFLSEKTAAPLMRAAIEVAERRRAMYLADPPGIRRTNPTAKGLEAWLQRNPWIRHPNVAMYWPWVQTPNSKGRGLGRLALPPSGSMMGIMARVDREQGVWKAPAGTQARVRKVVGVTSAVSPRVREHLTGLGINTFRVLPKRGIVSWGARTTSSDSEWQYIPVRRLALFLEESLHRGTQWVVFEPNDEPLWAQIRRHVEAFMQNLFRQGALQGAKPEEAFFVRCDRHTMTADEISRGIVNIVVGFAPLKPAEFVIIRIGQKTADPHAGMPPLK